MVTCIIDEMEVRDVTVSDITGVFLQTDMVHGNHIVRVRLCGVLWDLLVNINPEKFAEKVVLEGGQKVTYAVLNKALYGASIASLLFWWDLYGAPGYWGFEPKPYDSCVMNKTLVRK